MGTWAYASGSWTMSGSATRTVLSFDQTFPMPGSVRLQVASPAHNVLACVLGSGDLRTGWAVGINGANIVIRHRLLGGAPTVVATAAHGLPVGAPFTLEARVTEGIIYGYLNGSSTPAVQWDNTGAGLYAGYHHCGFESDVTGATVLTAEVCNLIQNVSPAGEVLFVVCDGNLKVILREGRGLARAGSIRTDPSGRHLSLYPLHKQTHYPQVARQKQAISAIFSLI